MQNIIMMYKRDIGNKIYKQMLQHFYYENGFLQEEVVGTRTYNLQQSYSCSQRVNLFSDAYTENIQSVLFEGIKRGVFSAAKFDSRPELLLARILETESDDVQNWLRPAPQEFNITYNRGHNYEPDFVVETENTIYLVEVKGEDKLNAPDVIAKKKRGIQYCEVASRWGKANGYKQWRYLFIPSKQVMPNSSFMQLALRFQELWFLSYGGGVNMDWKFWVGDVGIPIITFIIGLFTGKTIERRSIAKAKVDGNGNTVIQNSTTTK